MQVIERSMRKLDGHIKLDIRVLQSGFDIFELGWWEEVKTLLVRMMVINIKLNDMLESLDNLAFI